ncbi:MAG TPA: flagellar motor stator protein MotA [Bryobacteraceae bacterium]|nr:flagellar motor stator protein MotA [Bryobacteraceae bacterium]
MFSILGILVVFGAVIGGFLMEKGKLLVLVQPSELVIIGGAALGTVLVANPLPTILKIFRSVFKVLSGNPYGKAYYLESLKMLNDIFQFARKSGMAKLEEDVENPEKSATFSKYPKMLKDHHLLHFVCDTLRMAVSGVVPPFDLDALIENDIEVHHHEQMVPVRALSTVADALPGLGIVAAVLGVVITMGALSGPPEQIGEKVGAALVGTFLGILLSYGVVAPLAANIEKIVDGGTQFYQVMRAGLMAFAKGMAPSIAVEFARRAIPHEVRPTFREMEAACKGGGAAAAAKAA